MLLGTTGIAMTPAEAATALFKAMPPPITLSQLGEYGIVATESQVPHIAREILSLNLYWALAAIDAHIPSKYRALIKEDLFESIQSQWWPPGPLGASTWVEYQPELAERHARYAHWSRQPAPPYRMPRRIAGRGQCRPRCAARRRTARTRAECRRRHRAPVK